MQYKVDSDGFVIGTGEDEFEIKSKVLDDLSGYSRNKKTKYNNFKAAIAKQEPGEWIEYSGFPDEKQVRLMRNNLYRYSTGRDKTFNRVMEHQHGDNWYIQYRFSAEDKKIAVKVITNLKHTA